jgi:hypothetical protein
MRNRSLVILAILVSFMLISFSAHAQGTKRFGIRAGIYSDVEEGFIGAEFLARIAPKIYLNPNVEYVFVDQGTFMTFNADLHYDFDVQGKAFLWAGGGLGVSYIDLDLDDQFGDDVDDSETDLGLNLIFGAGIPTRSVIPYIQGKAIVGDADDLVLGIGVRF